MAKLVSKVYGEALFEVAVDHGNAIRLMNETAELQKILEDNPDFDKLISVIRSRDISVSIILQSLTQLDTLYSHATAMTILNNCDNWLYFGSQDMDTVNYVASRCYKTPESVMCMPRNKAYLITNGRKACYVDKITPYSTVGKKDLFDSIHAEIEVEDDAEISADALIHE